MHVLLSLIRLRCSAKNFELGTPGEGTDIRVIIVWYFSNILTAR